MSKMIKNLLCGFFLSLLLTNGFSQKDTRAVLEIQGGTEEICVTKSGAIWIATKPGNTYYTRGINESWHLGNISFDDQMVSDKTFERVNFFNNDTGFISGFIMSDDKFLPGKESQYNLIYRTTNKGKSWKPVNFGGSSWIDACYSDNSGCAWMSGSSQVMYFSDDFGATWKNKGKIVDKHGFRLNAIYFKDRNNGIIGTFGNDLYLTENNCNTWRKLETPLDQKKYTRVYANERPEFSKVLLYHDWIIVNQQGRIFYSKEDKIDWIQIPDCIDFSYDKQNDKLWILNKDLKVRLLCNDLGIFWTSKEKFPSNPTCIKAANSYLYGWFRRDIARINETGFFSTPIYTTDIPIKEPERIVKSNHITWGVYANELYHSDNNGKSWYRIKRFPFGIVNFKAINDTISIISDDKYNFYRFNSNTGNYTSETFSRPFQNFLSSSIGKIELQTGSQGCFHSYNTTITYELKKDTVFSVKEYNKSKQQKSLPDSYKNTFLLSEITKILTTINNHPFQPIKLSDFNINAKDKENYMDQISVIEKDFSKGNRHDYETGLSAYDIPYLNPDFRFFRNYADSLQNINDSIVNKILSAPQLGWSTTTNWISMKIINKHGDEISIENSAYKPNAWLLPWTIKYGDFVFQSVNLDITKFIKKNSPDFIVDKNTTNDYLIFQIVNYLYNLKSEVKD